MEENVGLNAITRDRTRFSLNPETGGRNEHCCRCKANLALKTGETICTEEEMGGKRVIGYWMPLKEVPDVYVHFGIGTAAAMGASAECAVVNP